MNRKSTSVSSIVGVATALYLGLFAAQFQSAHADEAVQSAGHSRSAVHMSDPASPKSDDNANSSQSNDDKDQSKIQPDPATASAVPCNCSGSGSGCAGACPNAPGPKRHCKNLAPHGKPKMCSCVP